MILISVAEFCSEMYPNACENTQFILICSHQIFYPTYKTIYTFDHVKQKNVIF